MWRWLKPLLIGLAALAAVFVAGFVVLQVAMRHLPEGDVGRTGMTVYAVWALVMLAFPAFVSGYTARSWGAAYGVVLACIPILLWSTVNAGFPIVLYFGFIVIAAIGGHVGQVVSNRRHAP